jgi:exonuclease I
MLSHLLTVSTADIRLNQLLLPYRGREYANDMMYDDGKDAESLQVVEVV